MKQYGLIYLVYVCLGWIVVSCSQQPVNHKSEEPFRLLWSYEYSQQVDGLSSVTLQPKILNKSSVIVGLDHQLTSLSQEDGKLLWQQKTPDNQAIFVNKLNADSQAIYGKNDRGSIYYAVDLKNGKIKWQKTNSQGEFYDYTQDGHDDKYLYLSGRDSVLYVFDKQQGGYQDTIRLQHYARTVVSDGNSIYISEAWKPAGAESAYSRIISLDKQTHRKNWLYQTTKGGFYNADLVLKKGILYSGTTSGPSEFVALDAATGQVKWKVDGLMCFRFTMGDGKIFVNDGQYIVALDQQTGKELWRQDFTYATTSNVAWLDGYVYHAHNGALYVMDAQTGKRVAGPIQPPDGSGFYNLNAAGGKVFVQSDFHLYAYRAYGQ